MEGHGGPYKWPKINEFAWGDFTPISGVITYVTLLKKLVFRPTLYHISQDIWDAPNPSQDVIQLWQVGI